MTDNWLPRSGPMPRPQSTLEARDALSREAFQAPEKIQEITFSTDEFTSFCPRSGQPDYSSVTVTYCPREKCLESKSLKFYFWAFRNEGAFCETLAAKIANDIVFAISPEWVSVTVEQKPRGGLRLSTTVLR